MTKLYLIIQAPDRNMHQWMGEVVDSYWKKSLAEQFIKYPPEGLGDKYLFLAEADVEEYER